MLIDWKMPCIKNIAEKLSLEQNTEFRKRLSTYTQLAFPGNQCNSKKKVKFTEWCQEKANLDLTS